MDLMGGMRVVSIEQLFEGVLQMLLSGVLGKHFDGLSRKRAIMTVVPLNNLSICAAAGLIISECYQFSESDQSHKLQAFRLRFQ